MLSAAVMFSGCQGKDESVLNKDTLVVGMECNYAPYNWTQMNEGNGAVKIEGGSGYAGGYDVETAKIIAEKMGKKLQIKQVAWEGLIPAVDSGAIDLIIAGMSDTPKRRETLDFSDIYYKSSYVVLVKKGSPFENAKTLKDFKGAQLVGQKGTAYDEVIPQVEGSVHLTPLNTVPLIVHAIKNGAADGTVVEKSAGTSIVKANPDLVMIEFTPENGFAESPDFPVSTSIGMKKDSPELKNKINEILKGISEDERASMMEKAVENQPEGDN